MNAKFHAIFAATALAACLPSFAQQEFDAVAEGKNVFNTMGCAECHVVAKDDNSLKTGPSLYALFVSTARERETASVADMTQRKMVKADKNYFTNSVRKSWDELAVAESGPTKGEAYLPVMPMYTKEIIPDQDLDSIWHYLRTLADVGNAGPAKVMLKKAKQQAAKSLLEIPNEVLVTNRPRVFRAPLRGSSGRALHVGLPNGMNYTFDPRLLSVRNIWAGGFLNVSEERKGRGKPGSQRGQGSKTFVEGGAILQPLTKSGTAVDFEFKEPDVGDHKAIERWLWEDRDFPELQASVDAEFLGHEIDSSSGGPIFRFRVGQNVFSQSVTLTDDGRIEIVLQGQLKHAQALAVSDKGLTDLKVEGGKLADGSWSLDQSKASHKFSARIAQGGLVARPMLTTEENLAPQPLEKNTEKRGRQALEIPAGYSVETWESPKDLYGRNQLFEPTGIAVAKDGTIVVATRTAGVWRIRDQEWSLFAEGTYESLGVVIEDDTGDQIVVMQKPEMTRMSDTSGDGRANQFETVCDDYGFHANYHEYAHGPVRDAEGNYYFTLNLSHGGNERTSWRAGGPYMGSMGGYRGWACRVTKDGKFEPYANGLRSPAGLGIDPDGRLWYAENQGEYVGSSKVVPLEKGKFYGHLSGLVTLPGKMKPDSPELKFDHWKDKIRKGAVWLPHGKLANSPGHPVWDTTGGKFGVYEKQMFIGDQTLSTLLRVVTEKVDGSDQGCVIPFARGLASGVMRPCFLPDGSLLIGQTGRGWGARGGDQSGLQRISFDGKTKAADFKKIVAKKNGFTVHFTQPLSEKFTADELATAFKVGSWFYTNTGRYGSPEHERRDDPIASVKASDDRRSVSIELKDFGAGDKNWIDRIYYIQIPATKQLFGEAPVWGRLEAYFTLRAIPK
ncbi:MAG: cytochrome c2 [Verrucomicrobiales bacterium]|jgi:cytochrome c2